MDLNEIFFFVATGFLAASSGYLIYLLISLPIPSWFSLRLILFLCQHFFTLAMAVHRKWHSDYESAAARLRWIVVLTGVDFTSFAGVELYSFLCMEQKRPDENPEQYINLPLAVISYFHLYYQVNIYAGIFFIFALIMFGLYCVNQRNREEQAILVKEVLEERAHRATGEEEPCSICLEGFESNEETYRLPCSHTFHRECLDHWLNEKLNCPMCRDDLLKYVPARDEQGAANAGMHPFS